MFSLSLRYDNNPDLDVNASIICCQLYSNFWNLFYISDRLCNAEADTVTTTNHKNDTSFNRNISLFCCHVHIAKKLVFFFGIKRWKSFTKFHLITHNAMFPSWESFWD